MRTIKAIETVWKGCRFRSRLEARWAVFFHALGVAWHYEPQGFVLGGETYLPDFWLKNPCKAQFPSAGYWLEVKPSAPSESEQRLMEGLVLGTGHNGYIVSPLPLSANFEVRKYCVKRNWRENPHARCYTRHAGDTFCIAKLAGPADDESPSGPAAPPDAWWALTNIWCECLKESASLVAFNAAVRAMRSARFEHGESPE